MTRISTVGQNDFLLTDIFDIQKRIAEGTRQISSESKSSNYQGLALDVQALAAAKSIKSKSEQFLIAHRDLSRITDVQNIVLEGLSDIAKQLKIEMITASQPGGGVGFKTVIDNLYTDAVNLLNIKENGRFLFGGTRTDVAPVQSLLPANLEALGAGNHAQAFVNNSKFRLWNNANIQVNIYLNLIIYRKGLLAKELPSWNVSAGNYITTGILSKPAGF